MIIEISPKEILYRVRDIAQDELAVTTPDETLRYKIDPGSEKEDKVKAFINESFENLCNLFWRFLSEDSRYRYGAVENTDVVLPDKYVLEFEISERRAAGKTAIVTGKCATFLVQDTLMRYYLSVGLVNLAQNHANASSAEQRNLSSLLYTKALP